ncbi:hypothetical protein [uncultured Methanolobus sp.]|uniref:hypothetical protein n=1 Tax=uncultured Methanolobus sp. TaxID=218300 RepID=UPI0029C73B76|nr:hypothetical protein [uncultured Methanolobus sp.]
MNETDKSIVSSSKKIDREKLLEMSSWLVESLYIRLNVSRFKPRDGDGVKLQYVRALVGTIQAHNSILRDEQLETIEARLAALEGNNGNKNTR